MSAWVHTDWKSALFKEEAKWRVCDYEKICKAKWRH